jgi:putative membrane protein
MLGPEREQLAREHETVKGGRGEAIVMASGNLGLIYFTAWEQRLTLEQIDREFPALVTGLVNHPGIGFVMVRSRERGALAIGPDGVYFLDEDRFEGANPLAVFGPNAAAHLLRTDGFPHVADIMVNSFYDPVTDEVAAFEELVGSHGGMGGEQSHPFVLFPAGWELPDEEIVGAEQLNRVMRGWLEAVRSNS